jgi:ubiquinone/menaquinone biosynthesis C-methylase UbiE
VATNPDDSSIEARHAELNQNLWDSWAPNFDKKRFGIFRILQKKAIALAKLQPDQNFLDVGCGTGWAVIQAAHAVGPGGTAIGIDLSEKMIERAVANGKDTPNARFHVANAELMPLEDNFFDCIICTNSFHHYLHPAVALAEMYRILKTAGRVIILDVEKDDTFMRFVDRVTQKFEPEHVSLYSKKEFQDLFESAGLAYTATKLVFPFLKAHMAEKR